MNLILQNSSIDDLFPEDEEFSVKELEELGLFHEAEELEQRQAYNLLLKKNKQPNTLRTVFGVQRNYLEKLPEETLFKAYAGLKHSTPTSNILEKLTVPQIVEYFVGTYLFLNNNKFKKEVLEKSEQKNQNFVSALIGMAAREMGYKGETLVKKEIGKELRGKKYQFETKDKRKKGTIYQRTKKFSKRIEGLKTSMIQTKYQAPQKVTVVLKLENKKQRLSLYRKDFNNPRFSNHERELDRRPYLVSYQDRTFSAVYAHIIADNLINKYDNIRTERKS